MHSFMLQDWISPVVDENLADLVQSEADWLNLQNYQDAILWVEARGIYKGAADQIQLLLETAPTKDPTMFAAMAAPLYLDPAATQPFIVPVILSQFVAGTYAPLSRWVRWKIKPDAATGANWGATFRVYCSANLAR